MDLYAENILEHYRHPHGKHVLESPTVSHTESNPSCGDSLTLSLVIDDNRVMQCGWTGEGCAISQAGMSMMRDDLVGKTIEELLHMTDATILEYLGVTISPRRLTCALLPLHVLQNALRVHCGLPVRSWSETLAKA